MTNNVFSPEVRLVTDSFDSPRCSSSIKTFPSTSEGQFPPGWRNGLKSASAVCVWFFCPPTILENIWSLSLICAESPRAAFRLTNSFCIQSASQDWQIVEHSICISCYDFSSSEVTTLLYTSSVRPSGRFCAYWSRTGGQVDKNQAYALAKAQTLLDFGIHRPQHKTEINARVSPLG